MKNKSIKTIVIAFLLLMVVFGFRATAQIKQDTLVNQAALFPKGNPAPASNFTGAVWVQPLMPDDTMFHTVMGSVTFSPGARSNWHTHPAGQILIVTSGVCYIQERGKPIQVYHKRDVIRCAPGVEHWHGASPDSFMTHLSINPNAEKGIVNWLGKVTDDEYHSGK